MTITIPPDLEAKVREKAEAEGLSVDAYIARLIQEDENWAECDAYNYRALTISRFRRDL